MARQERATRTRGLLIRAAAEALAEVGYARASLTDISRQAGVSSGALHFHFRTKRDLVQAVEDAAVAGVQDLVCAVPGGAGRTLEDMAQAIRLLVGRLARDPVLRAGFALGADVRWPGTVLGGQCLRWAADRLGRAEREGLLVAGTSVDGAARTVAAALVGCAVLGVQDPGWLSEQWAGQLWDLLRPGLVAGPPPPRGPGGQTGDQTGGGDVSGGVGGDVGGDSPGAVSADAETDQPF